MKEKLPLIAVLCLFIIVIVNFTVDNQLIVSVVGLVLFILVLGIRILTNSRDKKQ